MPSSHHRHAAAHAFRPSLQRCAQVALLAAACSAAQAQSIQILFVGNSYTFGRLDPVLTYNAANVRDLTQPQGPLHGGIDPALPFAGGAPFTNLTGTNSYPVGVTNPATGNEFNSFSPHSQSVGWGGVPGIFKQFTVQANLQYDVALSTRNAASLRGHFLNTANSNWDLRGNIGKQRWDAVVLQEQSDEALGPRTVGGVALASNQPSSLAYVDRIEDWIRQGTGGSYTEQAMFTSIYGSVAACQAAGGGNFCTSTTTRNIPTNVNANPDAQIYLQQTWARPNLINAPALSSPDPRTGDAIYGSTPATSFFSSLEEMTDEITTALGTVASFAATDGTRGIDGIIPVGQAFVNAVQAGFATRDMYAPGALADGLIDLWFNDGTHASVHGSYLSALTLFGRITGVDPMTLGPNEIAALDLGITSQEAVMLQRVASYTLGFTPAVPEPGTWALFGAGGLLLAWQARRRSGPARG